MSVYTAGGGSVTNIVRYGRDQMEVHEHQMISTSGDIYPGMLIERVNDGGVIKVQPVASTADTTAELFVAVAPRGRGVNPQDVLDGDQDPYNTTDDDLVRYVQVSEGGGLHVLLISGTDATTDADANVTVSDKMVSAGGDQAGTFKARNGEDAGSILLEAEESVDNSGASAGITNAAFIEATAVSGG